MPVNKTLWSASSRAAKSIDVGLREYMLRIYNYMSVALLTSAIVAITVAKSGLALKLFSTPLGILVALAPIFMTMYIGSKINKMSTTSAIMHLVMYASLMGVSLSMIFLAFNTSDISISFMITSVMFLSASIYGYTTKKDLSPIGSAVLMIIVGLIVASLVNLFIKSSGMDFLISASFVVLFAIMTAYDTQSLRDLYYMNARGNMSKDQAIRIAVMGAMRLYLDFINMFVNLLHLMRGRSD